MNKRERIEATLKGEEVDRPAVSFWRHFFKEEKTTEGIAEAMLGFQKKFDWDFMKVNPRAHYHVEDWGNKYQYSDGDQPKPELKENRVKSADDWKSLEVLPPNEGVLGAHLEALKSIEKGLGGETPFIMTVFTPLSIARKLVVNIEELVRYIKESPDALHQGLEAITDTFVAFSKACLDAGASGLFFATTECATTDLLTTEQYDEFGRRYDLRILDAVKDADFNLLHVCRSNNMLNRLLDYPVHAFNWDATDPTNPTLSEISQQTDKVVIGGVNHSKSLLTDNSEAVVQEAKKARAETGGKRWILGGGCTFSPQAPEENLMALRKAVEDM